MKAVNLTLTPELAESVRRLVPLRARSISSYCHHAIALMVLLDEVRQDRPRLHRLLTDIEDVIIAEGHRK